MIPRSEAARELAKMAARPDPLAEYIRLGRELTARLDADRDDAEADRIRDRMDDPWRRMTADQRVAAQRDSLAWSDPPSDGPELSELSGAEWVASCRICPGEEDDGEADAPLPYVTCPVVGSVPAVFVYAGELEPMPVEPLDGPPSSGVTLSLKFGRIAHQLNKIAAEAADVHDRPREPGAEGGPCPADGPLPVLPLPPGRESDAAPAPAGPAQEPAPVTRLRTVADALADLRAANARPLEVAEPSPDPVVWPAIAAGVGVGVVVAFAGCWVAAVVFGGK
jgi:hypothetical protein